MAKAKNKTNIKIISCFVSANQGLVHNDKFPNTGGTVKGKLIKPLQFFVVACLFTVSIVSIIMPQLLINWILKFI